MRRSATVYNKEIVECYDEARHLQDRVRELTAIDRSLADYRDESSIHRIKDQCSKLPPPTPDEADRLDEPDSVGIKRLVCDATDGLKQTAEQRHTELERSVEL